MDIRIKRALEILDDRRLDALLVSLAENITYLTRIKSRDAYLLVSRKENIYITDSRYTEEAKAKVQGCCVRKIEGTFFETIADAIKGIGAKTVAFEERYLPFAEYKKIKESLGEEIVFSPAHSIIEELRQIKTQEELKLIKQAAKITLLALDFIRDFIAPGKSELEIAGELERFIRYKDASYSAFEIIVASGPNSSYPHHLTSTRKIKADESVLIDLGVEFCGYKSDLTRVFFLGKIKGLEQKIYSIVQEAQAKAIQRIKPAVPINHIDQAARKFISQKGYGDYFVHNSGHGIGLQVHEAPHISKKEKSLLEEGMVFTVEPGIYLPSKFGVRIEDMVVVTEKGVELISGASN